ncbi:MAG: UDP-N-acetylglucosamine 4,6-dehydratase (inverting) [Myxococcales bacterium]|nr:UDP-N-acetylglucosamine 4,6-dehydratase (inverting) [Myxococcales bacterium]
MAANLASLIDQGPDLSGKVIFVTGGTGSFGRAFVSRLLAEYDPARVIVFSRDEQKHYAMQAEMDDPRLRYFVGDIRDRDRLMRALIGVDIVVHAAAMKHVPLAEYNPTEAIRTNIDGAVNIIDACLDRGVKQVVALSTDKAVSPVNLYGATKLCMEKLFVAANAYSGAVGTRFDLVRYGNVVGSKGSVVPIFLRQKDAGELTLTEPQMTRFWIGMDQAVDLVLLALRDGSGGEVYVPKIPACTVAQLADAVAPDAKKKVVGIRPGEKMHEVLITPDEARHVLEYDRVYVIGSDYRWASTERRPGGKPVANDFLFSSDIATQLNVEEVRSFLVHLGFLS